MKPAKLLTALAVAVGLLLGGRADAVNYAANSFARYINYASASGNDTTGNGSFAAPYETMAHAMAVTPGGGEVRLLGTSGAPVTYVDTDGIVVGKILTISAYNSSTNLPETGAAIIAGLGSTAAITLSTDTADLTLNGVIVDPSLNSGGPANKCVALKESTASTGGLTATNVTFRSWVTNCIGIETGGKVNITLTNVTMTGGLVNGGLYLNNWYGGTITITGGSCTLTNQTPGSIGTNGCVNIFGSTGAAPTSAKTATITNFSTDVTVDSGAGGGQSYGILLYRVKYPSVIGGTHRTSCVGVLSRGCSPITISTQVTGNDTEKMISPTIQNVVAYANTQASIFVCGIGQDGAVAGVDWPYVVNPLIDNCTADTGSQGASVGTHMLFIGGGQGGIIRNSQIGSVTGYCGIGVVDKETDATQVTNVSATGCQSNNYLSKGTHNSVWTNGTVTGIAGRTGGGITIEQNDGTGTNSTGLSISGFTLDAGGQSSFKYITTISVAGQTATFANNTYNKTSGTLNANPWTYPNGTNIANQAGWLAVEPTATFGAGVP